MAGRDNLDAAVAMFDDDEVAIPVILPLLEQGAADLGASDQALSSPVLWPIRGVPVLGRQFAVVRAGAAGGASISAHALEVVRVAESYRGGSSHPPSDVVAELGVTLRAFELAVIEADRGPVNGLVEPFRTLQRDFADQVDDLEVEATRLRVIVDGLERFLASDRYLALGANNAEMRLGSGMPLGIGEVEIDDGDLGFAGFRPSRTVFPPAGVEILDPDLADRWGFLFPTNDFRKLTYSARFDEVVAPQALVMWEAITGSTPDGVMLVDPVALAALLEVVGEVEVDGRTLTVDNALDYVLKEQYQRYGDRSDEVQLGRNDALSAISAAAAAKFAEGGWDPLELLRSLAPAARGRHLMMYSPDPVQQAAWRAAGIDGSVSDGDVGVFLLNLGASKLDPYVSMSVNATTRLVDEAQFGGEAVRIDATVTLRNDASSRLSDFSVGVWREIGLEAAGTYNGRLALYLPVSTLQLDLPDGTITEVFGADGSVLVAAWRLVLPRQSTTQLEFSYVVPSAQASLNLLPSARQPPVEWTWDGETFVDTEPHSLVLTPGS